MKIYLGELDISVRVWVAAITHKHGTDLYADATYNGMMKQLASYCRLWWEDTQTDTSEDCNTEPPSEDSDCVREYFRLVEDETYEISEAPL